MAKNIRATAVWVVLVAAICLGYAGFHAASTAEASRVAVAKKRAAMTVEMRELAAIFAAGRRPSLESGAAPVESPWRVKTGKPGDSGSRQRSAVMASDSKLAALSLAVFRATLGQKYRQFYRALGLSPQQIGAFENLLTARQEETIDVNAVASADGPDARPEIDEVRRQEDDDFRAAQIALLGEAGYHQLQEFNRALPVWNLVNVIETPPFPQDSLSPAQTQQLATILTGASGNFENGGVATLDSIDWNTALAQAQGFLSAEQMEGLKRLVNQLKLLQLGAQFSRRDAGAD